MELGSDVAQFIIVYCHTDVNQIPLTSEGLSSQPSLWFLPLAKHGIRLSIRITQLQTDALFQWIKQPDVLSVQAVKKEMRQISREIAGCRHWPDQIYRHSEQNRSQNRMRKGSMPGGISFGQKHKIESCCNHGRPVRILQRTRDAFPQEMFHQQHSACNANWNQLSKQRIMIVICFYCINIRCRSAQRASGNRRRARGDCGAGWNTSKATSTPTATCVFPIICLSSFFFSVVRVSVSHQISAKPLPAPDAVLPSGSSGPAILL